jgi:hypothetical protein
MFSLAAMQCSDYLYVSISLTYLDTRSKKDNTPSLSASRSNLYWERRGELRTRSSTIFRCTSSSVTLGVVFTLFAHLPGRHG